MPAFAPAVNPLVEDGDGVVVCVWDADVAVLVLVSVDVEEVEVEVLEGAAPNVAASMISWPVPQQPVFWKPQHHLADVCVPSQGVISASLLLSKS
jgi:hypothetical protein